MDLKLVCHFILLVILISAQASSAVETYDELYVGCFKDARLDRVLPDDVLISDVMTIKLCIDYCKELTDVDSAYAGVENLNECYCGDASRNYARLGVAEDGQCEFGCAGDSTTICGGASSISIYNLLLIRPPTTSVIPTSHDASTASDKPTEEINDSTIPISTHSAKSEAVTYSSVSTYTGSTTKYNMTSGSILEDTGNGSSLVPTLIYTLVPLFAIAVIVFIVCFLCRRKGHKHESSQGIVASGEPRESPGMRDNPTFESSNVHDLRKSNVADCQGGNDQYIALTTPHDGRSVQVYQTLTKVNSQGDGYEVPVNGANGQTGPEYGKTLHKLQEHPETDYDIAHEYQDLTNSVVGRNNSIGNESPIRGLQVQPETDYEAIHEYEDPGIIG